MKVRGFAAPLLSGSGTHGAVDVGLPVGTPIYAVADGVVHRVAYDHRAAGTYIEIAHAGGLYSRYLHLSAPTPSAPTVQKGQSVKAGDEIGKSGGAPGMYGAGNTTAPHLHFEIWMGPPFGGGRRVDPEAHVKMTGIPFQTVPAAVAAGAGVGVVVATSLAAVGLLGLLWWRFRR